MFLHFRSFRVQALAVLACISLLVLSACGGSGGTGSNTTSTPNPNAGIKLTVGGKLDVESQLLTKLYSLVLQHAGFDVTEKDAFGNNTIVFQGITSGQLDLYPEFTATGLDRLKLNSSLDDKKDYQTIQEKYEQQFKLTWLDYAPLNDTYAVCAAKSKASTLGSNLSDLVGKTNNLTLALPSDSLYVIDSYLKPAYGFTQSSFKALNKVDYNVGFDEVSGGQADLNFCYSTDVGIAQKNLVVINDDKHAFPAYHPAPLVRDDTLKRAPNLKDALNKLTPYLTTDVSISLQKKVADDVSAGTAQARAITKEATAFLQSKGLI